MKDEVNKKFISECWMKYNPTTLVRKKNLFIPNKVLLVSNIIPGSTGISGYEVFIEGDEYVRCEQSSKNMWANKKTGIWGSGYVNNPDDPRRVERTGRLGEMAVCKVLGTPVDFRYIKGGDKTDTVYNRFRCDVKTQIKLYGKVMVRCMMNGTPIKLDSDIYIFAYIFSDSLSEKKATLYLLGYLPISELITKKKEPKNNWVNYVCPYNELHDIKKLL